MAAESLVPVAFRAAGERERARSARRRREPRQEGLRIVEYTPYPRCAADARPRIGFTRDISASGMCIGVDAAEPIGGLLRVTVRGLDGRGASTSLERVVWCSAERGGRFWLGLELLDEAEGERAEAVAACF